MKLNTRIEMSVAGALLICIAAATLAVATNKLIDSIVTGDNGGGDWSIDENLYSQQ